MWISLALGASLVLLYFVWPSFRKEIEQGYEVLSSRSQQRTSEWIRRFGAGGPVVIVALMVAQMFLFVVPSVLLMAVCVVGYGPWWGSPLAAAAVAAASTVGYLIGASLGEVTVDRLIDSGSRSKLDGYIERYGVWAVIVTRISPVLSNDAISFVGGMLKMGYWRFMGATIAGLAPLLALLAYFGERREGMERGLLWVSGVSLAALLAYVLYDRTRRGSPSAAGA